MNPINHIQQKKEFYLTAFQTAQQSHNTMSNTKAWAITFLLGMKSHDREKGTVATLGGNPLIHMIPVSKNTEEAPEKATMTIKFTDKAKDTYVKFTSGTPEQAVHNVKLYYSLVLNMELEDNHETLVKLIKDTNTMIKDWGKLDESSLPDQIQ